MKLRETIPDETALTEAVSLHLEKYTNDVRAAVGHLEADYRKFKKQQLLGIFILAAGFVVPQIVLALFGFFDPTSSSPYEAVGIGIFIVSMVLCGLYGFTLLLSGHHVIRRFHAGVNKVLFETCFTLLGVEGELYQSVDDSLSPNARQKTFWERFSITPTPEAVEVLNGLADSELITEAHNTNRVDNLFTLTIAGRAMTVGELDVKHVTRSGKNTNVKHIFKGYFVSYELGRPLQGKTFVSTEGDEYGFGHRAFFLDKDKEGIRETKLEWNQFENLLHVATNNETEARYILTTDFMSDLYNWWETKKGNIRISFIGNTMYLLFPDTKIKFADTIAKIAEAQVQEYLLTIAKPLLHVVHLAEDVRL